LEVVAWGVGRCWGVGLGEWGFLWLGWRQVCGRVRGLGCFGLSLEGYELEGRNIVRSVFWICKAAWDAVDL
jgi:hypothetical protein